MTQSSAGSPTVTEAPRHASNLFRVFAEHTARILGSPWAFLIAVSSIAIWAVSGPFFHFSQMWQMLINSSTTVVTFLMVFLLQSTQMRDTKALHLKLDELLRAVHNARTGLVGLERLPDERLKELSDEFSEIGDRERGPDAECPPVAPSPGPG
ncbi:MAG TPA: low affinity iron permease family protein [Gemmatimonadales bacterium]